MEKNTILAVVLSLLVFILWSYFFAPKEPGKRAVQPESQPIQERQAPPLEAAPPEAPPLTPSALEQGREPREVEVKTNVFTALFSERGAGLKSFRLKKYRVSVDPNSPEIEMNRGARLNLTTALFRNSVPGLEDALYEASTLSLDLVKNPQPQSVTFRWLSPQGVRFERTYTFNPESYSFHLRETIVNGSQSTFDDNVVFLLTGAPFELQQGYYNTHGVAAFLNNTLETKEAKKVKQPETLTGNLTWAGYQDNYFLAALIPSKPLDTSLKISSPGNERLLISLLNPPLKLSPGQEANLDYTAYFGPKDLDVLHSLNLKLEYVVDFGWFDIIAKPLHGFLKYIYGLVKNYGIAIIILTILIKILFWPLTNKSYKSMKAMQKLQPHMAKLREKYKNDKQLLNQELMALYKTHKVNPFGGCLPMLIQIPVFFALYKILAYSIEVRHQPFLWWIKDLSAPDRLHVGFNIPYLGGLPVLTLLMGASMFIQQKMTPVTGDPAQAKIMMLMPIIFTFMFINFPSGLVLYWLINNILSIGQQFYINRQK
jgi:YidC/Oxa1 family membrane protein insertase